MIALPASLGVPIPSSKIRAGSEIAEQVVVYGCPPFGGRRSY